MSRRGPHWIYSQITASLLSSSHMRRCLMRCHLGGRQRLRTAPAGSVVISSVPKAGSYQVTASAEAWIDIIQDGKALSSIAHSGRRDCPDVRKSVRFDLQSGAVTVQVSGVGSKLIKLAILPAD